MTIALFSVDLDEVMQYRQDWLGFSTATPNYTGDQSEEAKHLVWIFGDKVAGIASIVPDMKKVGPDNIQWRLRAMAIHPEHRGNGKSEEFLQAVLAFAKKRGVYPLYGSGRLGTTALYEKLGAIVCENSYEIAGHGPHVDFVFA